jgi:murein DD-endopeptidase MepM/ murein hydrolase activator NlpD
MSLLRPIVDVPSGTQGNISQRFLGTYAWEQPGYVRTDSPVDRGKRGKLVSAAYYPHVHLAIDYICAIGTKVRAMKSGTIIGQGKDSSGALFTYQRLRNGTDFQVVALYYHLSKFLHPIGATVKKGDTVALSGNSGYSTGPHLHMELIRAKRGASISDIFRTGLRLDPQPFIDGKLTLRRVAP